MTIIRTRNGSHSVFVGDDAHISAATDPHSRFTTDVYIRDANIDTLVSLHLSPLALRELRDTCERALKSVAFEAAKDEPTPYMPREESDEDAERAAEQVSA